MSAKIITVFNQKGGCGKTTLCMQLAGAFAYSGLRTLVIDMDPQGTALLLGKCAQMTSLLPRPLSVFPPWGARCTAVKNHVDTFDVILIDCPLQWTLPSTYQRDAGLRYGTHSSGASSQADIWAAESAVQLAASASQINDALQTYIVPNMVQQQTGLARDMLEALRNMENLRVLNSSLGLRTTFRDCQLYGSSVLKFRALQLRLLKWKP